MADDDDTAKIAFTPDELVTGPGHPSRDVAALLREAAELLPRLVDAAAQAEEVAHERDEALAAYTKLVDQIWAVLGRKHGATLLERVDEVLGQIPRTKRKLTDVADRWRREAATFDAPTAEVIRLCARELLEAIASP